MVECLHMPLKDTLRARPPFDSPNWMNQLPFVLLGIRLAWREDANCSPDDLVFGMPLRLPRELFEHEETNLPLPHFLVQLHDRMGELMPPPPANHASTVSWIPSDLFSTVTVYIRHDTVKKSLRRHYDGPYEVVARGSKYFKVKRGNGKIDSISIDRLKPYYRVLEDATEQPLRSVRVPPKPCLNKRRKCPLWLQYFRLLLPLLRVRRILLRRRNFVSRLLRAGGTPCGGTFYGTSQRYYGTS